MQVQMLSMINSLVMEHTIKHISINWSMLKRLIHLLTILGSFTNVVLFGMAR